MRLGFIGTGGMGRPMAANLLKAGFRLTVHDLRPDATKPLEDQGATVSGSPREAAEQSEVVLSMLPVNEAVHTVAVGPGGLIETTKGARLWIDFSSVDRNAILQAEAALRPKGWTVVDASVSGVEEVAEAARLAIRAAGPKEVIERCRPIFEALGPKLTYVGALGNAKLTKTATAMLSAIETMATVEVFRWVMRLGISSDSFHDVLKDTQSYSESRQRTAEKIVSGQFKPRKSWMPKDIGFGLAVAEEERIPLPFTALAKQLFLVAQSCGVDGYEASGIAWKVYELLHGQSRVRRETNPS